MMSGGSFFDDSFQCKWKINKDFFLLFSAKRLKASQLFDQRE